MRLTDFDYELPQDLIAQVPAERREDSRLMVVTRATGEIQHRYFHELPRILQPGDLLVLNDTRVFPARLFGKKVPGGASIEVLLLEEVDNHVWKVMARRAKRLRPGMLIQFSPDFTASIQDLLGEGIFLMRFTYHGSWQDVLEQHGQIPLPPYISRESQPDDIIEQDRQRYQTVYATANGSAAAPTAGLHFSESLLEELALTGIQKAFVTLHIGLDTFQPVKEEEVEKHPIHAERFRVPQETAQAVNLARSEGRRVIAVGTTAVRALETSVAEDGSLEPQQSSTRLFILPGYQFRIVDAMLTNFHLPRSTLLMLVSAFMGSDLRRRCYEEAVRCKYRFYSYGDAMLIL